MKVSVVMASGSLRPLTLRNTLLSWGKITHPVEFILINTDDKSRTVEKVAREFGFVTRLINKSEHDASVDWATTARMWTWAGKHCSGDYVIFAMADEILGSYDVVEKFINSPTEYRSSARNYFMSSTQTSLLDTVDWLSNPKILEDFPYFWEHHDVQGADNTGNAFRRHMSASIYSHITGAPREHWDYMGWFRTDEHGYFWLDMDVYFRETVVNRPCHTVEDFYCYHQWHPLLEIGAVDRDYGGYIYTNEQQARLLEPARHIATGEYR